MSVQPIRQSDPSDHKVDAASIRHAYDQISPFIVDTPVIASATFSDMAHCQALFKLENLQMTGSFKDRGGINKLLSLTPEERQRGQSCSVSGLSLQAPGPISQNRDAQTQSPGKNSCDPILGRRGYFAGRNL